MARRRQRQPGATRTATRNRRQVRDRDDDGILPVLARAVREVEASAERGTLRASGRTKFQVVALLVREERARVNLDESISAPERAEQLKRLDGVAKILAKTAARDTSLLALLAEDAVVSDSATIAQARPAESGGYRADPRRRHPRARRPRPTRPNVGWFRSPSSRGSSPIPS